MSVKNIAISDSNLNKNPRVLDLFAGAGGLSEGFIRAGCEMIGHIEMDKNAHSTILTRSIYHSLVKNKKTADYVNYILGKITRDELVKKYDLYKEKKSAICAEIGKGNYQELISKIRSLLNEKPLDIIVGGPPCQAYSYIGRARDEKNMSEDKRNYLYRYYIEFLKAFKPKIFVFENVPGLEDAGHGKYLKDMRKLMKSAGYDTDYRILNAVDYGVPQNRKRIFLIGWNNKSELTSYPEFRQVKRRYVVKDFFTDLPKIRAGEGKSIIRSLKKNKFLFKLGITNNKFGYIIDHISRPNNKRDLEIYRIAVKDKKRGINTKYNNLPEKLKTHKNEKGFLDRFKVVDGDASGSHTIVAHIAKDGHFYIHPDPVQNRSLSIREAARLQTFPDDYKFEGNRSSQLKQIGNAVPPMLAEVIAKKLVKFV